MDLIVGAKAGFCYGIGRAIRDVEERLKKPGRVFMLGPITHNPQIISSYVARGVSVADSIDEIIGCGGDREEVTVIIRSHGVPPSWIARLRECGFDVLDLTCPFVARTHELITQAEVGTDIIIAGEAGHPEVLGLCGCCEKPYVVLELSHVEALPFMDKALLVAQSTLTRERFDMLCEAILPKVRELDVHNTICQATIARQEEARIISGQVDAMIVVGGKNSSNTRKLYELCASGCANTVLIESKEELSPVSFSGCGLVGITAGASTSDCIIKEVISYMNDMDMQANDVTEQGTTTETAAETAQPDTQPPVAAEAVQADVEQPAAEEAQELDPNADVNFTTAFEKTMVSIRSGQTVRGKIVQIREEEICVNIGYKSDGIIKRSDIADEQEFKLGDEIDVEVVKVNDGEGNVILSQKNVINRKNWDNIVASFEKGEFVEGVGREAVKGGLIANVMGIRTFIPASQLSLRYVERIEDFVGKRMKLKIIEIDKPKKRIVASAKAVLIEEENSKKKEIWGKLTEGEIITGTVRRLTDFGAFVDIGGVDGLVHVADLSWGRVKHPSDIVSVNQEVQVKILTLDEEKERISLGYKQLQPKPWDVAGERYPASAIVTGKVVRIVTFGAFVELEPGLDGLVHISQCAPTRINKVEDAVTVGDYVRVKILSIDPDNKRISLSIRDAMSEEAGQYDIMESTQPQDESVETEAVAAAVAEPSDETDEESTEASTAEE